MRNLNVNRIKRAPLELTNGKISGIVVVDDVSALYYVRDGEFCMVRENQETILSPEIFDNVLVEPEYLSFERRVWFATHDKLVYYCCETEQLTIIPLQKSAYCFAWNPTREILAVVHEDTEVATYSVDLENGCAQRLDFTTTLHNAVPHGVYVGWGSADTQFRGSEGKLRKKTTKTTTTTTTTTVQCTRRPVEDKMPRITWRGNGEMFAVNYWRDDRRTFKVFQQDCKPLYECCYGEDEDGLLQSVIAWRPEGNMIANSVRLEDDRYCVIVFEKNGYKRFSVPLVYERYEVKELKWSHRGEILAVLQEDHYLSLYTTSNYKWYLKQHLVFEEPLISFGWSTIFDLQVFTQNDFFTYEFQMVYDVCDDCVAVIDGNELHLTRFRNSCLPPPLTQITVRSERNAAINSVALSQAGNQLQFAIVDCDWHVSIYSYENDNTIQILSSFKIQPTESTVFQNFHWFKNVLFCVAVPRQAQILLVSFTDDGEIVSEKQQSDLDLKRVRNIQNLFELNSRLYQLENEVVFIETERNTKQTIILSEKCLLLKSIYCSIDNESYVFSLTATNDFYINDRCVSKSVTSFIVLFNRYLLLTTATNNLLYCIRLLRNQLQLLNNDDLSAHFFHRPIEQGARLICGVNDTSLIILQIPRGNLEIISCRPIAIDILEHHLSLNDWQEALHFLRTDRLNFNLLIDLNMDRFLKNIDKFVEACKTPAVLNTFIQEIEESNVLQTIYLQCYHHQSASCYSSNNKRTLICNALLSYFQEVDYANYAIPIVTLALNHFGIEMALKYIKDLYHRLPQTETALANAVKTLIIHARTEGDDFLFKKSLQLYDTNFTRHICSFTQMDPKFYLPFLNELDDNTEVQRRYNINVYLKKPELAVQYLMRDASAHADVLLQYIERHRQVLPTVYSYYSKESPMFQKISKLYGDWLSERKQYTEAAVVYSLAELWMETFAQYKLANDWLAAITILNTKLLDVVKDRHGVITAIGDDLIRIRKYKEAATIQEQYLNNYEDAIKTLLCGYHFRDAIFLTVKHKRQDIIIHDIIPTIERYCLDLEGKIQESKKNFHHYKERLLKLRAVKLQKYNDKNSFLIDEEHQDNTDFDLYSDAGTTITNSTRSTSSRSSTRSSKNRRKEERKKQDLREGGVYEDIALIRALHVLIEETFKMGSDVRELCLVLLELDMRKDGNYLHKFLMETQREMKDNVRYIWPDPSSMSTQDTVIISENFNVLDDKYKSPPCVHDDFPWQLSLFTNDETIAIT